ncbi:hypothetical protein [Scytonema millei]|uniref:Uncharacterized protein n=1 Tax=Scytonema millei VB511283 TaxID=1245923 RepID=A0A9X5I4X2_9CYAN|nr:hypothetical protein [Scytonema millei]NHC35084.1 hypothetical protein [Scytonema millei VB511283]
MTSQLSTVNCQLSTVNCQLSTVNNQSQPSAIGDYIIMIDPQIQRVQPMISFLYQKIKLSRSQNRIAKVKMPAIAQDA